MSSSEIVKAVLSALDAAGGQVNACVVEVRDRDGVAVVRVTAGEGATPPTIVVNAPGVWLSSLEERILKACADGFWITAAEIAVRAGERHDTPFKVVLRNLVDRGLLESCQRRGYRICESCERFKRWAAC